MSDQYPQVFEGILDAMLAGTVTEPEMLKTMLRQLLVTRRRYNDPDQIAGRSIVTRYGPNFQRFEYERTLPTTYDGCLGLVPFSNKWTIASQKARVEAGIAFLKPLVGAAVGDYPPLVTPGPFDIAGAYDLKTGAHVTLPPESERTHIDTMGNRIPPGMP